MTQIYTAQNDTIQDDDYCSEPVPEWIEFTNSRIAGTPLATCKFCKFSVTYWDCAHEFEHDCNEYQNN